MPVLKGSKASKGKNFIVTIGRRKEATARVCLVVVGNKNKDKAGILVNSLSWEKYFSERPLNARKILQPFEACGLEGGFSVVVTVKGGGKSAQIDAVALGVARGLILFDPSLKPTLRRIGMLTRDSREKERKKPGFLRARKKPQFSKR